MAATCENYSAVSLWDKKVTPDLLRGIHLSKRVFGNYKPEAVDDLDQGPDGEIQLPPLGDLEIATTKTCSVCCVTFSSRQEQVLHFKLDWHCENLKRRDEGLPPLGQQVPGVAIRGSDKSCLQSQALVGTDRTTSECEDIADQNQTDSDGSTSASDTEQESSEPNNANYIRRAKIYFENENGDILSVYKCILLNKKDIPLGEAEVINRLQRVPSTTTWAVLLLGGGHFAGGIFKENEALVHKTFHRYIVRAKQGSAQSMHDQQRKHAKSAGAQLRRHNEHALTEDIQTLCQTWSEQLKDCTHIFYRATGNNKRILFGGKTPIFKKGDGRLCSIPFPTKQATHKEVVRIHSKLSTIECYGRASEWKGEVPQPPAIPVSSKRTALYKQKLGSPKTCHEVGQCPPNSDQKQEDVRMSASKTRQETPKRSRESSFDSNNENLILNMQEELFSTTGLQQFEVVFNEMPVTNEKASSGEKQISSHFDKAEQRLRNALYTACRVDDSESLKRLLSPLTPASHETENSSPTGTLLQMVNSAFGNTGSTLLHICAQSGYKELVLQLLECGADPAIANKKGQPAYVLAVNKETRNTFRKFMALFPEKYDYVTAQIPSPLSEEVEKAKLIKLQQKRQQKKQRAKALKLELEEKATFLNSTDMEKKLHSQTQKGASRCFFCGESLENKVPFSYDAFKFCTLRCLQQHRRR